MNRLRRLARSLRNVAASIAAHCEMREIMLLAGLALTGYGASWIYWPLGFLVAGGVMLGVAILGVR